MSNEEQLLINVKTVSWKEVETLFYLRYDEMYLKKDAKAHLDMCEKTIGNFTVVCLFTVVSDGAKGQWREILILDAMICHSRSLSATSPGRAVRRHFDQQKALAAAIQECTVDENKLKTEVSKIPETSDAIVVSRQTALYCSSDLPTFRQNSVVNFGPPSVSLHTYDYLQTDLEPPLDLGSTTVTATKAVELHNLRTVVQITDITESWQSCKAMERRLFENVTGNKSAKKRHDIFNLMTSSPVLANKSLLDLVVQMVTDSLAMPKIDSTLHHTRPATDIDHTTLSAIQKLQLWKLFCNEQSSRSLIKGHEADVTVSNEKEQQVLLEYGVQSGYLIRQADGTLVRADCPASQPRADVPSETEQSSVAPGNLASCSEASRGNGTPVVSASDLTAEDMLKMMQMNKLRRAVAPYQCSLSEMVTIDKLGLKEVFADVTPFQDIAQHAVFPYGFTNGMPVMPSEMEARAMAERMALGMSNGTKPVKDVVARYFDLESTSSGFRPANMVPSVDYAVVHAVDETENIHAMDVEGAMEVACDVGAVESTEAPPAPSAEGKPSPAMQRFLHQDNASAFHPNSSSATTAAASATAAPVNLQSSPKRKRAEKVEPVEPVSWADLVAKAKRYLDMIRKQDGAAAYEPLLPPRKRPRNSKQAAADRGKTVRVTTKNLAEMHQLLLQPKDRRAMMSFAPEMNKPGGVSRAADVRRLISPVSAGPESSSSDIESIAEIDAAAYSREAALRAAQRRLARLEDEYCRRNIASRLPPGVPMPPRANAYNTVAWDPVCCQLAIKPDLEKGVWCRPGRMVGVYEDGVGPPSPAAMLLCVVLNDDLTGCSKSRRHEQLQEPAEDSSSQPERMLLLAVSGEVMVHVDNASDLQAFAGRMQSVLVCVDEEGQVRLTEQYSTFSQNNRVVGQAIHTFPSSSSGEPAIDSSVALFLRCITNPAEIQIDFRCRLKRAPDAAAAEEQGWEKVSFARVPKKYCIDTSDGSQQHVARYSGQPVGGMSGSDDWGNKAEVVVVSGVRAILSSHYEINKLRQKLFAVDATISQRILQKDAKMALFEKAQEKFQKQKESFERQRKSLAELCEKHDLKENL